MNELIISNHTVYEIKGSQLLEVPEDGKQYHAADLVYFVGLQKTKKHKEGVVKNGKKYEVTLLAVVSEVPENKDEDEVEDSQG